MSSDEPRKSIEGRWQAIREAQAVRARQATPFGQLFLDRDHWRDHHLGELWRDTAKAIATQYPEQASRACDWSTYFFERYNKEWAANLPSSRFDSDGGAEIEEVHKIQSSLKLKANENAPDWLVSFMDGDWAAAAHEAKEGRAS